MVSSTSSGQDYLIFLSLTLPGELAAVTNTMQKSPDKKRPLNLAGRSTSDHFETSTNGGSKHSSRLQ